MTIKFRWHTLFHAHAVFHKTSLYKGSILYNQSQSFRWSDSSTSSSMPLRSDTREKLPWFQLCLVGFVPLDDHLQYDICTALGRLEDSLRSGVGKELGCTLIVSYHKDCLENCGACRHTTKAGIWQHSHLWPQKYIDDTCVIYHDPSLACAKKMWKRILIKLIRDTYCLALLYRVTAVKHRSTPLISPRRYCNWWCWSAYANSSPPFEYN